MRIRTRFASLRRRAFRTRWARKSNVISSSSRERTPLASGGGILISQLVGAAFASARIVADVGALLDQSSAAQSTKGPYRPDAWNQTALTMITVPAVAGKPDLSLGIGPSSGTATDNSGNPVETIASTGAAQGTQGTPAKTYVFDAVHRLEHDQEIRMTEHPVQTGANLVDHAYVLPARVTLEIGMSDAMDSYSADMWGGNASKSANAYQILVQLQQARLPLTLTTRLNTYTNMLIQGIHAADDNKSRHGLRATVALQQIFIAQVTTTPDSSRPQTTDTTVLATIQPQPLIPAGVYTQNAVPAGTSSAIDAGFYSSNPTASDPLDDLGFS